VLASAITTVVSAPFS